MADRSYAICVGPVALPGERSFEMIQPPQIHIVRGSGIKILSGETNFFQIIDSRGDVKFSTPTHLVVWCKAEEGEGVLAVVTQIPIQKPKELPKKSRRTKKDGDG